MVQPKEQRINKIAVRSIVQLQSACSVCRKVLQYGGVTHYARLEVGSLNLK